MMAKVKMPLLGVKASGQIGKSVVLGSWRGVQYARTHVHPANPRTAEQMKTRGVFSFLNELWKRLPPSVVEVWQAYAAGRPLTDRNAFLKFNVSTLRGASNVLDIVISPGVAGGYPPADVLVDVDAENNTLTVDVVAPPLPSGWDILKVHVMALKNEDPHGAPTEYPFYGAVELPPYTVVLDGLTDGTSYVVAVFMEYTKPDGTKAYGPSVNTGPFTV